MKKFVLFFIAVGLLSTAQLFAQDKLKISAQIRPRLQLDNKDFSSTTGTNSYTELRSRLGASVNVNENLSGFIQIQDSRLFGSEPNTLADTKNLDLHQAYFNIKNFFKLPLNLKVGRMELSYGSQRLIGAVGWHNVGRSFDAGVLTLVTKPIDVDFILARTNESGLTSDTLDSFLFSAYGNMKIIESYKLQPFVIGETRVHDSFSRYTIGLYMGNSAKVGFAHELDAAYQLGTQMKDVTISAFMVAYNLKFTFNTKVKPMIGAGIDYLSGDDGENATKYKVFNTLYATNHKFYGYMDYFLNIPRHTYGKGLIDIQGKASIVPFNKFLLAAAYHYFSSSVDYTLVNGNTSTSFGSEIDITLVYKYDKLVKFVGGFSYFMPGDIFKENKGEDSSTWTYLMAIVDL